MKKILIDFAKNLFASAKDLAPIVLVIAFFQIIVLQQPMPNFVQIAIGSGFVLLGLTLFIYGLHLGLFPMGEALAFAFTKKNALLPLSIFAFALGFGTTFAEPALIAIANEAARVQLGELATQPEQYTYAQALRYSVATSVGLAVLLSVLRIVKGWPLMYFIISGYLLVITMTFFAPDTIIGIAYDSGGVATSTITVPLITALGIGLASSLKNRNPLTDGFGVIAIAVLLPIVAVMIFGMVW